MKSARYMESVLLEQCCRRLRSRVPLFGGWLRRRAVAALATDASPEAVQALAGEVWRGDDVDTRRAALHALRDLASEGNTSAQEALCRYVINHDDIPVREEVLAAGFVPAEESQKALFYFITGQWNAYETLDFDRKLLRTIYASAGPALRRGITAAARDAGRLEWVGIASGGRQGRRLATMTDAEWKAAVSVLNEHERWTDLWNLALDAPPRRSAAMFRRLKLAGWVPAAADRDDFDEFVRLAEAWPNVDLQTSLDCRTTLRGHTDSVSCLAFHPRSDRVATGSGDRTVRLWHLPDGKLLQTLKGHKQSVTGVAISPDGRVVAGAGRDRSAWLWRLPDARKAIRLLGHSQRVLCLAITPNSRLLATGSADSAIQLWSLPDGKNLRMLDGHQSNILAMAISPNGEVLASASADATVRLWSLPDGKCIRTLRGHRDKETDAVNCVAISADGRLLATGGTDGNIGLWSLPGGGALGVLEGHLASVSALAITPDNGIMASGGADQTVRLWRLPDGKPLAEWEAHSSDVTHLAMSIDSSWLASASGNGLGYDHSVKLWSLHDRCWIKSLYGHDRYITCLGVSPNGRYFVTGSGDGTARVWSAELPRLCETPVGLTSIADLEWVQRTLHQDGLPGAEKNALAFIAALILRRRRYDVEVEHAAAKRIEAGEFDIEIEG
jgi:WD40 repeat protein